MYNPENKHYILRNSSDKIFDIFHSEKNGLCCSMLTKRNTWSEPVVIQKSIRSPFCADIGPDDSLHILFQDGHGNVYYSRLADESVKTVPVLSSKSPSNYNKHMLLLPFKSCTHLFYMLSHNKASMLVHQTLEGETPGNPRVVDYVATSSFPYSIVFDKSGNIYAFYQSSDGKSLQIGFKKYSAMQKKWSGFTPITSSKGDHEFPRSVIDNRGIVHLCFQKRVEKQFELVYRQLLPDKDIWSDEQLIHSSLHPFNLYSVVFTSENISICWVRDDTVFFSSSSDFGTKWSKPARHSLNPGKQLVCISYRTNAAFETDKINAFEMPGCFINGFRLAFYQPPSDGFNSFTVDELRNTLVDSLKMLKVSLEELKDSQLSLSEELRRIRNTTQEVEKELVKCSLRINLLENDSSRLKNLPVSIESFMEVAKDVEKLRQEVAEINEALKRELPE